MILPRERQFRTQARKTLEKAHIPKRCMMCGSAYYLHIHHINGDESDNNISNLIYLCSPCHLFIHKWESMKKAFIEGNGVPPSP